MECKYRSGGTGNGLCGKGCHIGHYAQLNVYDYLADIPGNNDTTDLVEVQFKNTRKGYYHNINNLPLEKGDVVAVESNPGHDIVSVAGGFYSIWHNLYNSWQLHRQLHQKT